MTSRGQEIEFIVLGPPLPAMKQVARRAVPGYAIAFTETPLIHTWHRAAPHRSASRCARLPANWTRRATICQSLLPLRLMASAREHYSAAFHDQEQIDLLRRASFFSQTFLSLLASDVLNMVRPPAFLA